MFFSLKIVGRSLFDNGALKAGELLFSAQT